MSRHVVACVLRLAAIEQGRWKCTDGSIKISFGFDDYSRTGERTEMGLEGKSRDPGACINNFRAGVIEDK
jgi:hypothetical protein